MSRGYTRWSTTTAGLLHGCFLFLVLACDGTCSCLFLNGVSGKCIRRERGLKAAPDNLGMCFILGRFRKPRPRRNEEAISLCGDISAR